MKDKPFDIKIEVTARVLPREMYNSNAEKIMWDGLSSEIDFEAKSINYALKDYLENLAKRIMQAKFPEEI